LRSADAFGVQEVHLIDGPDAFLASQRVTQGTDRWLELVHHADAARCVASLHGRGFRVYVATMDGDLSTEELARVPRAAVVFGNEHSGVGAATAALCDGSCTIPMRGFAQSLNVSVAAAITLYSATRGRSGDLDAADRAQLRARFMMLSVPRADSVVRHRLGLP
jgi:tRNA (guanosine-2'-O-)-methyltransferase